MPGCREGEASFIILDELVTAIVDKDGPLLLERIDIDATEKEASNFPPQHPARDGLAYSIDSSSTVTRGANKSQGYVFPPMWRTANKKQNGQTVGSLTDLVLTSISHTHRALILNLGPLFLMIQWLTHTSVQLYPRNVYESTVKLVNKKLRKFHIGMALVFENHVIAFLSSDLLFQPTWASTRDALPPSPSDFYHRDWDFLPALARWMSSRLTLDRNGLACTVIRAANEVFLGISTYTVVEIFFLAGLSPILTEFEVFNNPSRVARFCGGYFEFLHRSRTGLRGLLRPAMKDGYLAPTMQHRIRYLDWLHVYAKDRCRIPVRMTQLVDDYVDQIQERTALPEKWIRYDTTALHDVFEPTFLSTALSLDHNLGHLVFGMQTWIELGGKQSDSQDAVTAYFHEQGLLDEPTFLRAGHYSPLLLENKFLSHRTVHAYRNDKQIWSITPLPENSQGVRIIDDSSESTPITEDERKHMLFSYIVQQTRKFAVGPLESSGNAHRVSVGGSSIAVPCYGDPSLPDFYAKRDLKHRLMPSTIRGRRKPRFSDAAARTLEFELGELANSRARKRGLDDRDEANEPEVHEEEPRKPKKRRMSADQRLALGR
ncbi:hypothetical protein C8R46DRAFT_1098269 [Mycena filopes]|nr:hypothetical protein C8R46DRAFT_1098269 [Mycena filopes]